MVNYNRTMMLLAATAGVTLASPALAGTPVGATPPATATARIVRPLKLTKNTNLDFGTIVLSSVTVANTVALSNSNVLSCGTGSELVCSGTTTVANFTVKGTNNETVKVLTASSTLNGSNGGTLTFTPASVANVSLGTTGASTGANFDVGGSIVIDTLTADGLYTGDMDVTVDYN